MKLAVAILIFIAATGAADACRPVSPGSSVLDCRSAEQIEQTRAEAAKAQLDPQRATEERAKAEQEDVARSKAQKPAPQVAKGPTTDPAELLGCRVTLAKFYQLRDGMSYYQVRDILGCNGTLFSRSDVAEHTK